ncbi:P-loop containing nucleoside triphosphate hydrolase [Syntrophomonas zehnderi OL-4]|uniref:p-loop containing nucleoside triphosphate hydrolase n=1 Tax=Syntrophomonas zehnderi OL-4 TaxID=690567 RepID=A0A0E4C7V2_9FIRM|nr:P-loop containing nucleoside triphosphate hydrolase [Syntrophomonas zehnderi OL-4]
MLIIIDTLQMIRRPAADNSYANDYADLTALKRLADKHRIAILLIHHLRKQKDDDPFNRISGTTGLSGAVDTSFTLVEERRGSGRATLSCIGRDIEYRELELRRNENNIWELVSDSREHPELLLPDIVFLVSDFMKDKSEYHGTPTELSELISREENRISDRMVSRLLLRNTEELAGYGIRAVSRRSSGRRMKLLLKGIMS